MRIDIGGYILRDWRLSDAPDVARYANNRKIWMYLRDAFPHPYGLKDAEDFLRGVTSAEPRMVFAIAAKDEAIGSIGFMPGRDVHRFTTEMGYWLAEPYWGRGIATEAVKALVKYGFTELKFMRIFAEPYATNPASARVLEKAGFTLEGLMRASAYKDGRVVDQLLYARIREEAAEYRIQ